MLKNSKVVLFLSPQKFWSSRKILDPTAYFNQFFSGRDSYEKKKKSVEKIKTHLLRHVPLFLWNLWPFPVNYKQCDRSRRQISNYSLTHLLRYDVLTHCLFFTFIRHYHFLTQAITVTCCIAKESKHVRCNIYLYISLLRLAVCDLLCRFEVMYE